MPDRKLEKFFEHFLLARSELFEQFSEQADRSFLAFNGLGVLERIEKYPLNRPQASV